MEEGNIAWRRDGLPARAFNLHRRGVPTEKLKEKCDEFVLAGDLSLDMGRAIITTIENERGKQRLVNGVAVADDPDADNGRISERLTLADMQAELDKRVGMMRAGAAASTVTDQARVFDHIVSRLESGEFLRLMVQASAGGGSQGSVLDVYSSNVMFVGQANSSVDSVACAVATPR